jgi:hypothetical protein
MGSKKFKEKKVHLGKPPKKSLQAIEDARKASQRQHKQRFCLNHRLSNVIRKKMDIVATLVQLEVITPTHGQ